VIIDGVRNIITIGGANRRADFNGLWPLLLPGLNKVTYKDTEGSRTIELTVTKEDRTVG
jgi:hypothetical protein